MSTLIQTGNEISLQFDRKVYEENGQHYELIEVDQNTKVSKPIENPYASDTKAESRSSDGGKRLRHP
jgi:hypothetical protein